MNIVFLIVKKPYIKKKKDRIVKKERYIRMKKSWGKPIVQVQLFVPQEYIAGCSLIQVRGSNGRLQTFYIDYLYPPRYYNDGEEFNAQGQITQGNHDGKYSNVTVYGDRDFGWLIIPFYTYPQNSAVVGYTNIDITIKNGRAYNVS